MKKPVINEETIEEKIKKKITNNSKRESWYVNCDKYNYVYPILLEYPECFTNREIMIYALSLEPAILQLSNNFTDKEFILDILRTERCTSIKILKYIPDELQKNDEFMKECIKINPEAIGYASDKLKSHRETILNIVKKNGRMLIHASDELALDKEICLAAVGQNHNMMSNVPEIFRDDRAFMLAVIKINGECFNFASKELKSDYDIHELECIVSPDSDIDNIHN